MRRKIAAGNWKMNTTLQEGKQLIEKLMEELQKNPPALSPEEFMIVLAPPFITLESAVGLTRSHPYIRIAAQNCYSEEKGAYTGEISAAMIRSTGAEFVIIGHSERREYFAETHSMLAKKINVALQHGLTPIFCCGEKLEVREKGNHIPLVQQQIAESLFHLQAEEFSRIVIAYEPVWAIGTGVNATPDQAQEMHQMIRQFISEKYNPEVAENLTILYGGSVNAQNASELFAQPDVDGGLVGGASLKADEFIRIIHAF